MRGHDTAVTLGPVLELPPLSWTAVVGPLTARIGRCAAYVQFALVVICGSARRRQDHVVGHEIDSFLGTEPGVVHDREEGDEPRPAWLLGAHCLQQRSRLMRVHDAPPVHLAGNL